MNIFYLDQDPRQAAQQHLDKHVVKMVLESAQMLSTAHRLIDGCLTVMHESKKKVWLLPGEIVATVDGKVVIFDRRCYAMSHVNHPCSRWVRESASNYLWLYQLMIELDLERQFRFNPAVGKTIIELGEFLSKPPQGLQDIGPTKPAQAMPEYLRCENAIDAYRSYYKAEKRHIARWTKREQPVWFS